MTSYADKGPKPESGRFVDFDHLTFWVGNAKQTASYYATRLGFEIIQYKGLETGSRDVAAHACRQGSITFVFVSMLNPGQPKEMGEWLSTHGDGVKDVAFSVEDLDAVYDRAKERGAVVVKEPWEESDDVGVARFATIKTFGDITHTFVDRTKYRGEFLPGFTKPKFCGEDPVMKILPDPLFERIDHVVGNQPEHAMDNIVQWYERMLTFHRFWSADDSVIHTPYSSLSSTVVANYEETIKIPINEPAGGEGRSQTKEFVDYFDGPGIQHIAVTSSDIVQTVKNLRARGMIFLDIPDKYYDSLRERLDKSPVIVTEDLDQLQEQKILLDFNDEGYLLQIFTKLMQDRPTLFIEVIQKKNHEGFGAGNFKSLFEALEMEQRERGTLFPNGEKD